MNRASSQDTDGTTWATVSLPLGAGGMDLRKPSDPPTLADLVNARFQNERTIQRRSGYLGTALVDGDSFPGMGDIGGGAWVYGHGNRVVGPLAYTQENAHYPPVSRGAAVFDLDGSEVVWTGDRLLIPQASGPALGQSTYWGRDDSSTTPLPRGIPAFLPLETDSYPPSEVQGDYLDTCLTISQRFVLHTDGSGGLWAYVINRTNGQVISRTEISGASNDPRECRIFNSGSTPVALWRDNTATSIYLAAWNGEAWSASTAVSSDAQAYDLALVSNGFHLIVRTAAGGLKLTQFAGASALSSPYAAGTAVVLTTNAAGPVAINAAPDGSLGIAYVSTAGDVKVFRVNGAAVVVSNYVAIAATNTAGFGLAICCRLLKDGSQFYEWVIHACNAAVDGVVIRAVKLDPSLAADYLSPVTTKFNSTLASKSFLVGDEVFCWLRSTNAGTHYLLAGVKTPIVAGYADREEAIARVQNNGNYAMGGVAPDPLGTYAFTWIRPHNTGSTYNHVGSVRQGDINCLPNLCSARFGLSVYLSGSAVKNWDGENLLDAGFQDYPTCTLNTVGGSGATVYQVRVYAVFYNAKGERFQSAALTVEKGSSAGSNGLVSVVINTLPSVTQDGVVFEVYRSGPDGQALYLDGTINNSFTAATVTYTIAVLDADIANKQGDPHAPVVGVEPETDSWGPIGCSILVAIGDRLWGAGGQVPAGFAQFSLLKDEDVGAGFDDLAGGIDVSGIGGDITSISAMNNAVVMFQRDRIFVIGGGGPDNFGNGSYEAPQLNLAAGAISHFGTTLIQGGILYWGGGGPLLLSESFTVQTVSSPVRPLTNGLTPVGVLSDVALMEVVWFCEDGNAVLLNYMGDNPRWARWTTPEIVGCSDTAALAADGTLLVEDDAAPGDYGYPYGFGFTTGDIRPEQLREGCTLIRKWGVSGNYEGEHSLRLRLRYNGSPLWEEETTWEPEDNTWLSPGTDFAALTPAQIDALLPADRSGQYSTHKRLARQTCHYFSAEVSDVSATGPTYTPHELSFEIGAKPGLGRTPINTFRP